MRSVRRLSSRGLFAPVSFPERFFSAVGVFFLILLFLFPPVLSVSGGGAGSGSDGEAAQARSDAATVNDTWLMAVYMAGDNSLSGEVSSDLEEMRNTTIPPWLTVVVLADQSGVGDTRCLVFSSDGEGSVNLSDINPSWGDELRMDDGGVLSDFLTWTVGEFQPSHVFVDLWGHGRGWSGVLVDGGSWMSIHSLENALDVFHAETNRTVDILGFDQCNMAMASVAWQLSPYVSYFVFSEKEEDARGWPYDAIFENLTYTGSYTAPDAVFFARVVVDSFINWSEENSPYSATLSVVDSKKMDGVVLAVKNFTEIGNHAPVFREEMRLAAREAEKYTSSIPEPVDMVDLFDKIGAGVNSSAVRFLSNSVVKAVKSAVVYERHFTSRYDPVKVFSAHGLAVYVPLFSPQITYRGLRWGSDTGWWEFVSMLSQSSGACLEHLPHLVSVVNFNDTAGDVFFQATIPYTYNYSGTFTIETWVVPGPPYDFPELHVSDSTGVISGTLSGHFSFPCTHAPGWCGVDVFLVNDSGERVAFSHTAFFSAPPLFIEAMGASAEGVFFRVFSTFSADVRVEFNFTAPDGAVFSRNVSVHPGLSTVEVTFPEEFLFHFGQISTDAYSNVVAGNLSVTARVFMPGVSSFVVYEDVIYFRSAMPGGAVDIIGYVIASDDREINGVSGTGKIVFGDNETSFVVKDGFFRLTVPYMWARNGGVALFGGVSVSVPPADGRGPVVVFLHLSSDSRGVSGMRLSGWHGALLSLAVVSAIFSTLSVVSVFSFVRKHSPGQGVDRGRKGVGRW